MDVKINGGSSLNGVIYSSPSKSYSHRAFFLSLIMHKPTRLERPLRTGDVTRTVKACSRLGGRIAQVGRDAMSLDPPKILSVPLDAIDCGNSGTTVRILAALTLILEGEMKLRGVFFTRERPIHDLLKSLETIGTVWKPIDPEGTLTEGISIKTETVTENEIRIPGDVSSQYITGLIIAACALLYRKEQAAEKGFSANCFTIKSTTKVKSFPYVLITKEVCEDFGFSIDVEEMAGGRKKIVIKSPSHFMIDEMEHRYQIAGDFSSAAFMIAAGALFANNYDVEIKNLSMKTNQGDKEIITILSEMGAEIVTNKDSVEVHGRQKVFDVFEDEKRYIPYLKGQEIDFQNIPDLFPILAVVSSYGNSKSILGNAEHVRHKETDRIEVLARELSKFNVKLTEKTDGLIVQPYQARDGSEDVMVEHNEDHRIIMALTIFCLGINSKTVTIHDISAVSDSYPEFFSDLQKLGADIELLDN